MALNYYSLLKNNLRLFLGDKRVLVYYYKLIKKKGVVKRNIDIVIEGAPSCANSFAIQAFKIANPKAKIAHHIHLPIQVIMAAQLNIPTLVLIRDPIDMVASLVARDPNVFPETLKGLLWIRYFLKHYISFYEKIIFYKDRYVIGEFGKVIKNYASIISKLNKKFGTSFNVPDLYIKSQALKILPSNVAPKCNKRQIRKKKIKTYIYGNSELYALITKAKELWYSIIDD